MPKPPLARSNNDDRRQWRKQGVAVGAAASKTQAKRCGCWVPQPGQWQRISADGEVDFLHLQEDTTMRLLNKNTARRAAAAAADDLGGKADKRAARNDL